MISCKTAKEIDFVKKYVILMILCTILSVACSTPINSSKKISSSSSRFSTTPITEVSTSHSSSKNDSESSSTSTFIDESNSTSSTKTSINSESTNTTISSSTSSESSSSSSHSPKYDVSSNYQGNDDYSWGDIVWG